MMRDSDRLAEAQDSRCRVEAQGRTIIMLINHGRRSFLFSVGPRYLWCGGRRVSTIQTGRVSGHRTICPLTLIESALLHH